jgi:hypothetical protein
MEMDEEMMATVEMMEGRGYEVMEMDFPATSPHMYGEDLWEGDYYETNYHDPTPSFKAMEMEDRSSLSSSAVDSPIRLHPFAIWFLPCSSPIGFCVRLLSLRQVSLLHRQAWIVLTSREMNRRRCCGP